MYKKGTLTVITHNKEGQTIGVVHASFHRRSNVVDIKFLPNDRGNSPPVDTVPVERFAAGQNTRLDGTTDFFCVNRYR
jgi:hypothetical protein